MTRKQDNDPQNRPRDDQDGGGDQHDPSYYNSAGKPEYSSDHGYSRTDDLHDSGSHAAKDSRTTDRQTSAQGDDDPDSSIESDPKAAHPGTLKSDGPTAKRSDESDSPSSKAGKAGAVAGNNDPVRKPAAEPVGLGKIKLIFPNGSQGKQFDTVIPVRFPADWPKDISLGNIEFQLDGFQECGIDVEIGEQDVHLSGQPKQSGDVKIVCTYVTPDVGGDARPSIHQRMELTWVVNPDPRALWKCLEPDQSLPYHKPHTDKQRVAGSSVMLAASVRGRSHAHEGTFRDDDFCIAEEAGSGWKLMVVSDGAGSAKYSRRGAEITCKTIQKEVWPHFSQTLGTADFSKLVNRFHLTRSEQDCNLIRRKLYDAMGSSAMKAYKAIQAEAETTSEKEIKHFSATVVFSIAKQFDFGWFVAAFCIGDGGVGIYSEKSGVRVLNKPDGGEFAGQTRFISMPEIWASGQEVLDRIDFDVQDDVTAIIAMTDGVTDPKFQTDRNYFDPEYWHALWKDLKGEVSMKKSNMAAADELLTWLDFWSTGNHDDRTISILIP